MDVKDFQNMVSKSFFGTTVSEARGKNICVICKNPCNPENFKDDLSRQEYQISGMCQKCQDKTFG